MTDQDAPMGTPEEEPAEEASAEAAPTLSDPPPEPAPAPEPAPTPDPAPSSGGGSAEKSRITAGVLALVPITGALGVHKFYLGYMKEGAIMAGATLLLSTVIPGAPWLVALIEGIMYLTKTDAEFQATYVQGDKPWF